MSPLPNRVAPERYLAEGIRLEELEHGFYHTLLENLYDGVYFLDLDRRITYWNRGAERITGYAASEVVGRYCRENLLNHVDNDGCLLCPTELCPATRCMDNHRICEEKIFLAHKGGYRVPVLARVAPIRNQGGETVGAVEIFTDRATQVDVQRELEALQNKALLDPLTEIGNRRYAQLRLEASLREMQRHGWVFGALFIDIDHFKGINDEYGHEIGDKVLRMVAKTILNSVRPFDTVTRWGGEEFLVIADNLRYDQLWVVANRIRLLVEGSSFLLEGRATRVTVSVGAALAAADDTAESVVARADRLMFQSKQAGRNRVSV